VRIDDLDCASGEQHDVVVTLIRGGTHVTGLVVDGGGKPIPGVRVKLLCLKPRPQVTLLAVDENGRFEAWVNPGMTCQVNAQAEGYDFDAVLLAASSAEEQVRIELQQAAAVAGQVVDGDAPVPGADVACELRDAHGVKISGGAADADGRFVCSITAGDLQVCASAGNRFGWQPVRSFAGQRTEVLIRLGPARRIRGTVKLPDGSPAQLVTVHYHSRDFCARGEATTDIAGLRMKQTQDATKPGGQPIPATLKLK
jgi:hypothetical protein